MSWLQEQNKQREDYKNEGLYQRKTTFKSIFCNKSVRRWIFLTAFAASVPILMYYFIIDQGTYRIDDSYTCLVQKTFRVPCGKVNITSKDCINLQCCYDKSTKLCYHYLPSRYSYDLDRETKEYVTSQSTTPFGTESVKKLKITVNELSEDKVSVILHDANTTVEENSISGDKNYVVNLAKEKLMVEIFRNNDALLLSTAKGPLIASEYYWEWSFYLTNHSLFGLNQTLIEIKENSTFTKVIYKNKDDHYSLPVFWAYRNEQFHGVVIKHDGPLEITILPSYMVLLKSLTGKRIELELSVGPTPKLLHDQQLTTSNVPPYWALQTHICRKGSNTNLTQIIQAYSVDDQAKSDCIDENLFLAMMKDDGQNTLVIQDTLAQLQEKGIHLLLSIPPQVFVNASALYTTAENLDMLYEYNETIYKGKYIGEEVVYPDYSDPSVQTYIEEFHSFLSSYVDESNIDGFILYDNWPVNEQYRANLSLFPYSTQDFTDALSNTLPWNSTINNGSTFHIGMHNNYGSAQISAVQDFYNSSGIDMYIMSASKTFGEIEPGIIQNVNASWTNLQLHLDNILFNSIVGNHLVSVPVCGDNNIFNRQLQETLCIRWYLVAATMPIFHISSSQPWRDPNSLNSIFAQNAADSAIQRREMLLPYYYTILSKNEPIIRPMFYDFYDDIPSFKFERQYMVGDSILVSHPFSTGRNKLQVYLPSRIAIWYEIWGGNMYNSTVDAWHDVDVIETDFVAFVAQGNIVPLKVDNNLNLVIALNCTASCEANGTLLLDNYIDFLATDTTITVDNIPEQNCNNYTLGTIQLYYYQNDTGAAQHFIKNEELCTGQKSITITYESEN